MAPACRGAHFAKFAAALAATLSFAILVNGPALADAAKLKSWREAPPGNFVLPSAGGLAIDLASQRGRIVLVHFFATWCEPCREELPALRRLAARGEAFGITVLAISVAEVEARVRRFLESTPVNFPVLLDKDRAVAKAWKITTLPSTVILDTALKPKLIAETDLAWDPIEPSQLIEMLGASTATKPAKQSSFKQPNLENRP